jgi:hypothetical protein
MLGRIERPVLELKGKTGLLGTKESYVLPPFVLGENLGLGEIWEKAEIPESLRHYVEGLEPTLLNTYRRRYYLSADGNYRVTLDSGLGFYRIRRHANSFLERRRDDRTIIVELKFGYGLEPGAARISNHFPFRLSRSSKYVRGIEELAA